MDLIDEPRRNLLSAYGVTADEIDVGSADGRQRLAQRVGTICRGMRKAGLAGDWSYSLPDHRGMVRLMQELQKDEPSHENADL